MIVHNMEDYHRKVFEMVVRRELLKVLMIGLVSLSLIMAVGIPLLWTAAHDYMMKIELSLMNLRQENSELTTAMKKIEKSLVTLKQEVNSGFAIVMKKADQSLMEMKQEFYSEYICIVAQAVTWLGTLFTG